jgi:hypothetical protein
MVAPRALIWYGAFAGSGLKEVVSPDGCRIDECAFWRRAALGKVSIESGCASIGESAFAGCGTLTTVTTRPGWSFSAFAFDCCLRLASVKPPLIVWSIDRCYFGRSLSMATIAFPKRCRVDSRTFDECNPHVTRF